MKLPISFDLTPKGNIQYNLQFEVREIGVMVSYYGEDDTYFDEDRIDELIKKFQ